MLATGQSMTRGIGDSVLSLASDSTHRGLPKQTSIRVQSGRYLRLLHLVRSEECDQQIVQDCLNAIRPRCGSRMHGTNHRETMRLLGFQLAGLKLVPGSQPTNDGREEVTGSEPAKPSQANGKCVSVGRGGWVKGVWA